MRETYLQYIREILKRASEEQLRAAWIVLLRMIP